MKEKFMVVAERFVEYLKNEEYDEAFGFEMNDGHCDFNFGIKPVFEFDNWTFVVGMYGDTSVTTMKLLTFEDEPSDWDEYIDEIAEFLSKEYGEDDCWTPIV